jgi:hypothetical protein
MTPAQLTQRRPKLYHSRAFAELVRGEDEHRSTRLVD